MTKAVLKIEFGTISFEQIYACS